MIVFVRSAVAALAALMVIAAAPAAAQTYSLSGLHPVREVRDGMLERQANLVVKDVELSVALTRLHKRSGVPLAFSPSVLPSNHLVTCFCESATVGEALNRLLAQTSLRHSEWGRQVVIEPLPDPRLQIPQMFPRERALQAESFAVFASASSGDVARQQPTASRRVGTITGRVVDESTLRPLSGVQVVAADTELGALTDNAGRFLLINVPAGNVTLRAQLIGYATAEQVVNVQDNETVTANFELNTRALALDAVVVTGTPGGTQRRSIGNVVERLEAPDIVEASPATDLQQVLGGRTAGVSLTAGSGQVGGVGGTIRIRGVSSRTQSNSPLLYVDGVRVDDGRSGPSTREGAIISRMNDFNPEDIESIEVIKGPAAATLYGTEASAGVIQIITKRGSQGAPRFDFTIQQGTNWLQNPEGRLGLQYDFDEEAGVLRSQSLYRLEKEEGLGPVFQNGHLQSYTGSVSGGTASTRYYVSADWEDNVGIVDYNWSNRFSSRANLSVIPRENLTLSLNTGYLRGKTSLMQQSSGWDIWSNLVWGSPRQRDDNNPLRGFLRATPEEIANIEATSDFNRFTTGATVEFEPVTWLAQRAVVGLDVTEEQNIVFFPRHPLGSDHFFGGRSLGQKEVSRPRSSVMTVDFATTATFDLSSDFRSASSVGFQYYRRQRQTIEAEGEEFPAPGLNSVSAGATRTGSENFSENATVGLYIQQQVDWRNRFFLTGAIRGDDNSAFGAEYDAALYPKLSAAWVINEEPFWTFDAINTLRLRAAWGAAGQQPGTFDAIRLYSAITGHGDGPALTPGEYGNPQLKPERSEELEVGFDAALWEDRLDAVFTYYTRTTKDAILNRTLPPSLGFSGSQVVNLGETKNWGWELALNAAAIQRESLGLDLGVNFTRQTNKITDLGGTDTPTLRAGFPIASQFWFMVVSADVDENGIPSNMMCDSGTGPLGADPGGTPVPCGPGGADAPLLYWGQYAPRWEFAGNATLRLFNNLRLYGMVEARGDYMGSNNDLTSSHTSYQNTSMSNVQDNAIFQAYRNLGRDPLRWYDGEFWKLREVSATYTVPSAFAERFSASRATISLAGRNLWTIKAAKTVTVPHIGEIPDPQVWDTEMNGIGNLPGNFQSRIPPLAQVVATIRFAF